MPLPNGSIANLLVARKTSSDPTSGIPLLFLPPHWEDRIWGRGRKNKKPALKKGAGSGSLGFFSPRSRREDRSMTYFCRFV
jgi:hypothetical protein